MYVKVSGLSEYYFCPMSVYLRDFLKALPEENEVLMRGKVGHVFRKELNLRQSKIIEKFISQSQKNRDPVNQTLKNLMIFELDKIAEEVPLIYRIGGDKYFKELKETYFEVLSEIDDIAEKLDCMIEEIGAEETKKKITPWKIEFYARSEKLNLCGRMHKVMREQKEKQEEIYPIEIKTGENKNFFGSESDRIQVCAYIMLLEDQFNTDIPYGFLHYARTNESIPVMNTEQLRRKVLWARNEVSEIFCGKKPVFQANKNKCDVCVFKDKCEVSEQN